MIKNNKTENCEKHPTEVFYKKGVLKNFANFTGKQLCWNLFLNLKTCNFIKKRFQHRCFPVKFVEFLSTPILKDICKRLLSNCVWWQGESY